MKRYLILFFLLMVASGFTLSAEINKEKIVQRGCCSHHGGVCGCSYGRTRCCDGSLSPSCMCLKDDKKLGLFNAKKDNYIFNITCK